MEAGSLLHLPRVVKRIIAITLVLCLTTSATFLALALIKGPEGSHLVPSAVSLFQFLATGAALAVIAFYSTKNIGTDELLAQTTLFLVNEMPRALLANLIVRPLSDADWSTTKTVQELSIATVKTDHVRGTISAAYLVEAFGSKIKFRVTLNAFRFVVLYYVPHLNHSEKDIEVSIALVTAGAETVGYTHRVATNPNFDDNTPLIEIYFYKTSERDLLLDTSSRLFWSQDIAVMTKSMLLQLKRGGIAMEYVALNGKSVPE